MNRVRMVALAVIGVSGLLACAHGPRLSVPIDGPPIVLDRAPLADSATLALWHLDEPTGFDFADSGSRALAGIAGVDSRPEFGRFKNGRRFVQSIDSFGLVTAPGRLELGTTWSIEMWMRPISLGLVELSVAAARWTPSANEQSWLVGVTGLRRSLISGAPAVPGVFESLVAGIPSGSVVFILQPEVAGAPRTYASAARLDLDRWTHVAVTHDGQELRIYLDGRLDAQYAEVERVRPSAAPLVLGNLIDPRWLVDAQGSRRVQPELGQYPFYAFNGVLDEVRLSTEPRIPPRR